MLGSAAVYTILRIKFPKHNSSHRARSCISAISRTPISVITLLCHEKLSIWFPSLLSMVLTRHHNCRMSSEASTAAKPSSSQAPARTKNTSRLATGTGKKRSGNTLHSTDITVDTEEGITSTLMVSPIKSGARILTVTPSTEALTEGPPRPKKRGKKLFASGS